MLDTLIPALAALIGTLVGAVASVGTTLSIERARAARERRQSLLGLISDAIFSGDRTKAVQSKVWMATVAERRHLRQWIDSRSTEEIVLGMYRVLLDPINAERRALGLEELELKDLVELLGAREDSDDE